MNQRLQFLGWLMVVAVTAAIISQLLLPNDPKKTSGIRREDLRTVEVKSDGTFLFAETKMDLNRLESALVQAFRNNPKIAVAIRADTKEDYGDVMKVLSVCQRNGIFKIGMTTRNE